MTADPVLERLDEICRRLDGLQEAIERSNAKSLSATDRSRREILLPAIWAVVGDHAWCGAELQARALNAPGLAAEAMRKVLAEIGSVKALGKFLHRIAETAAGGCRLEVVRRQGRDGNEYLVRRL